MSAHDPERPERESPSGSAEVGQPGPPPAGDTPPPSPEVKNPGASPPGDSPSPSPEDEGDEGFWSTYWERFRRQQVDDPVAERREGMWDRFKRQDIDDPVKRRPRS